MVWLDPPKGFSLDRHMDKIRGVMQPFTKIYENKIMSDTMFEDILAIVSERRRYKSTTALRTRLPSVLPFTGEPITRKALLRLALFLFEHDAMLRRGKLEEEWDGSPSLWTACRVVDVYRDAHTKPGQAARYVARYLVLSGPPAGYILQTGMSMRYASYLPKMLGVPARTPKRVMPHDAIGMVLFGQWGAQPGRSFTLLELKVSSSFKTKNKQLFNRRNP